MARKNKPPLVEIEDPIERNIIGAMMTDKIFVNWCFKYRVTEDCFEDERAKSTFLAIKNLKKDYNEIDLLIVSERLRINHNDGLVPSECLAHAVKNVDVKRAYTEMKKRLKKHGDIVPVYNLAENIERHSVVDFRYIVDFDSNKEFAYFCERFKMWVENEEINSCLEKLGDPSTSVYERQYCAGVLFAVKRFETIFGAFKETSRGDNMGINLYDLIYQYDNWKKYNTIPFPATFRSSMLDDEPLSDIPF